jgi:hypothetical protein
MANAAENINAVNNIANFFIVLYTATLSGQADSFIVYLNNLIYRARLSEWLIPI